ncbi:MAG TPA: aminotransferase class V-fold PLP-dependent enzyme, partial [Ignavibacteriaceae bacterium]|nr:aminotransferase class V-fold PLP-dependent enzyme [Ignavibacteriaceae bacterium]
TLNVPGIAGFGKALEIASKNFETEYTRLASYRNKMLKAFAEFTGDIRLNGDPDNHLPNNLNICFEGVRSENLIMNLRTIALSTGSACTSASLKPSHVLKAIGLSDDLAKSSIRFGLGRFNDDEEIDYVITEVANEVSKIRMNSQSKIKANIIH